ncbi:hemerythrin domain-containing protein [Ancylothrix sp. C2]|uniref:hemerythrin domain-containing protein n=1 Tax=Ancylothrix sp. D3o TaxID=2953691 RepID=UPI0021BAD9BC|nr:hemerythrin domain-containing protein [Ancylothrix sp. D3o]MCT7952120.1 hemerythrin domain-containing protein [Ancylothrix sp. D3o]
MPVTLEDTKRQAIGTKLADIKALQNLLISIEEMLLSALTDSDLSDRLRNMLEDDRKNLGVLDTVIVQYGVKGQPKETTEKMVGEIQKLMQGSELTLFEKFAQLELLKHKQTMSGLLIHKAAQVVGADVEAAITPLNTVNFENRSHQEQLKAFLEILGVRELTGQNPDQGIWARVQDAMAALTGVAGSVITRTKDDMNILEIIRMDHTKVNTLFMQVQGTNDAAKIQEYFGQIFKDLSAHAQAEEEVVYPAIRSYYKRTEDLYSDQAEMKQMLTQIQSLSPSSPNFKENVKRLMDAVMSHVRQEENEMFPKITENFSEKQQEEMATQFKTAKSKFQDKMAANLK